MRRHRVRYLYGQGLPWPALGHITARTHWVEEGVQGVVYPLCSNKPARPAWGWAALVPCLTCDRLYAELQASFRRRQLLAANHVDIRINLDAVTAGPVE